MRKSLFFSIFVLMCILVLAGCSKGKISYADGTYTATSSVYVNEDGSDEGNGYGVVTVTIKDGVIVGSTFSTFQENGSPKDSEYGKKDGSVANRDYYNKAQKAVAACNEYASQLVATGDIKKVELISGATVNFNEFKEAVEIALDNAKANN